MEFFDPYLSQRSGLQVQEIVSSYVGLLGLLEQTLD